MESLKNMLWTCDANSNHFTCQLIIHFYVLDFDPFLFEIDRIRGLFRFFLDGIVCICVFNIDYSQQLSLCWVFIQIVAVFWLYFGFFVLVPIFNLNPNLTNGINRLMTWKRSGNFNWMRKIRRARKIYD